MHVNGNDFFIDLSIVYLSIQYHNHDIFTITKTSLETFFKNELK